MTTMVENMKGHCNSEILLCNLFLFLLSKYIFHFLSFKLLRYLVMRTLTIFSYFYIITLNLQEVYYFEGLKYCKNDKV